MIRSKNFVTLKYIYVSRQQQQQKKNFFFLLTMNEWINEWPVERERKRGEEEEKNTERILFSFNHFGPVHIQVHKHILE